MSNFGIDKFDHPVAEQSWDEEIRARIKAVDEGRVTGITYDDLRKEMNSRYGA